MLNSQQFSRITYQFPRKPKRELPEIEDIQGIDTEAYSDGVPFMVCLSNRQKFHPRNFLRFLFRPENVNRHYGAYNLKYDSGALLYFTPESFRMALWRDGRASLDSFSFQYIPHKYLKISRSNTEWVRIWDISQFFKMKLDNASKKYLNEKKMHLPTKSFSRTYKRENFNLIKRYCIRDAVLVSRLANYLVSKLKEFGIRTTALYSAASLSFQYYSDRTTINNSWRFWKYHKALLRYAQEAYQGGKFEITARGSYYGYEYDITSAYPSEIANLLDISEAEVIHSKKYRTDAQYGYLRVRVRNPHGVPIPCGVLVKKLVVYPAGEFYTTITRQEYDYLTSHDVDVSIVDGYWLYMNKEVYPYRKTTMELFDLKAHYKKSDPTLSALAKTMANSFYGKTIQLIPTPKGTIQAGVGWNPMHASIITANTRIKVTQLQALYKRDCVAVHTDSVMLKRPIDPHYLTDTLGGFELKVKGPSVLVACGMYDLGEKSAFKGISPRKEDSHYVESWRNILERNLGKSKFEYPILKVQSWVEAASRGNFSHVNYFETDTKTIDLNVDLKRNWLHTTTSNRLLKSLEYSVPIVVVHKSKPEIWKEPS